MYVDLECTGPIQRAVAAIRKLVGTTECLDISSTFITASKNDNALVVFLHSCAVHHQDISLNFMIWGAVIKEGTEAAYMPYNKSDCNRLVIVILVILGTQAEMHQGR